MSDISFMLPFLSNEVTQTQLVTIFRSNSLTEGKNGNTNAISDSDEAVSPGNGKRMRPLRVIVSERSNPACHRERAQQPRVSARVSGEAANRRILGTRAARRDVTDGRS